MCANRGYDELHEAFEKRAIDEVKHAELLIGRILFLGGTPTVSKLQGMKVGATLEEMVVADEGAEIGAIKAYNATIAAAVTHARDPHRLRPCPSRESRRQRDSGGSGRRTLGRRPSARGVPLGTATSTHRLIRCFHTDLVNAGPDRLATTSRSPGATCAQGRTL